MLRIELCLRFLRRIVTFSIHITKSSYRTAPISHSTGYWSWWHSSVSYYISAACVLSCIECAGVVGEFGWMWVWGVRCEVWVAHVACGGYKQQFHSFQITNISGVQLKLVSWNVASIVTHTVTVANEIFQNILRIWDTLWYVIFSIYKTKDILLATELLVFDENRVSHSLLFCILQSHSMTTHTRCVCIMPTVYILL